MLLPISPVVHLGAAHHHEVCFYLFKYITKLGPPTIFMTLPLPDRAACDFDGGAGLADRRI